MAVIYYLPINEIIPSYLDVVLFQARQLATKGVSFKKDLENLAEATVGIVLNSKIM
jgi:hypothetical protein